MADQMRTGRTTAIKKAEAAGVTYKGSAATTTIAPSVNAPSSKQRIRQARERLVRDQRAQNEEIRRDQNSAVLKERIKNQVKLAGLQTEQLADRAEQKLEQEWNLNNLKLTTAGVAAQGQLNVAGTAAAGQVAQQNAAVVGSAVKALINFSTTFAQQRIKGQQLEAEWQTALEFILGPEPTDGSWSDREIAALRNKEQQKIKIAGEEAIQKVEPDDPIERQNIRSPNDSVYSAQIKNQNNNLRFANSINAGLSDFMTNGTPVEIPGRGIIDPRHSANNVELATALRKGIRLQVMQWIEGGGKLDFATAKTIKASAEKAFNYQMQIWGPKIEQARIDRGYLDANTQAQEQLKSGVPLQEIYETWIANTMPVTGLTKQSINKKAVEHLVKLFDNEADLLKLRDVQQVPGQKGTELGNHPDHRLVINKAIIDLGKMNTALEMAAVQQIEDNMYEELFKLGEDVQPADREAIINRAIRDAETSGASGIKWAFDVRKKLEELASPGGIEANAKRLNLDIIEGRVRTDLDINRQYAMGYIDKRRRDSAIQLLKEIRATATVQNPLAKKLVATEAKALRLEFLVKVGLTQDKEGNVFDPARNTKGSKAKMSSADAERIANNMSEDINRIVNTFINQNPHLKDPNKQTELLTGIRKELALWIESNVTNPGGKYYLPEPRIEAPDAKGPSKGYFIDNPEFDDGLQRLREEYSIKDMVWNEQSTLAPKDLSVYTDLQGQGTGYFDREFRDLYNPRRGDRVFKPETLLEIQTDWEQGIINKSLLDASETLKIRPIELLNNEVRAHGSEGFYRSLPPQTQGDQASNVDWTPPSQEIAQIASTQTAGLLAQAQQKKSPMNSYQGALYLIKNHGLPHRGAAWLAGNIEQESSWQGQRSWGPVLNDGTDRNGGLVSWANDYDRGVTRFDDAEDYLGPITEANNAEQLDYMMHELKTDPYYKKAYKIFMNPWSSQKDLRNASIRYWGYDRRHEGSRYKYAQDTYNQLITPPPIK